MQTVALITPLDEAIDQLSRLCERLSQPAQPTLVQLSTEISVIPPLQWLNAQQQFPKLYWHSRDHQTEAAIAGTTDQWWLNQPTAEKQDWQRLSQNSQSVAVEWRYYGGQGFTPNDPLVRELGGNRLYLPKIEYRRQHNQYLLIFYFELLPDLWQEQLAKAQHELSELAEPMPFVADTLAIDKHQHQPDFQQWQQLVKQVTTESQLSETPKVVLCRETQLTTHQPVNCWQLLRDWQGLQPSCYQFGIQVDRTHSFFGCSPERLFLRQQQLLTSEALAGTCSKGKTDQQQQLFNSQLLQDEKNIHENALVVEDIRTQLEPLCLSVSSEAEPKLVQLNQLTHLCREISAQLKPDVSEMELLKALHPTAAVGGLPRANALQFLQQFEPVNRGWYAGAFGMVGEQQSEFCVTIRSIQQQDQQLGLFAGAGIVAGSEPYAEWHELNSKLASAMAVLQACCSE